MTVKTARPTVGTTRADLSGTESDSAAGYSIEVYVVSGSTVYVGGPDVTAANGRPVKVDASVAYDLAAGETLHGVTASATSEVAVTRTGA